MKKALSILFILSIIFSLSACGGVSTTNESKENETKEQTTSNNSEKQDEQPITEAEVVDEFIAIKLPRLMFSGTVEEITAELNEMGIEYVEYDEASRTFTGAMTEDARSTLEKKYYELYKSWTEGLYEPKENTYTPVKDVIISDDNQSVEMIVDASEMNFYDKMAIWYIARYSAYYQYFIGVDYDNVDCSVKYVNTDGVELQRASYKEWLEEKNEEARLAEKPQEEPTVTIVEVSAGETITIDGHMTFTIKGYKTGDKIIRGGMMTGQSKNDGNTLLWLVIEYKNLENEQPKWSNTFENITLTYDNQYTYKGKYGAFDEPAPLSTIEAYPYFEIPKDILEDDKPITFTFEKEGIIYSYTVR